MNTWLRIRIFGATLILLRAPLIAFSLGILLPCPSQMQEVFQINVRDLSNDNLFNHFIFSAIIIIFTASIIYLLGRLISLKPYENSNSDTAQDNFLVLL